MTTTEKIEELSERMDRTGNLEHAEIDWLIDQAELACKYRATISNVLHMITAGIDHEAVIEKLQDALDFS